jgi:hypothetical protein
VTLQETVIKKLFEKYDIQGFHGHENSEQSYAASIVRVEDVWEDY